ncbi:hypothetical protein ACOQ0N_004202 [Vibrio parahaemolyticus]|uniref:hypothetical protein n=2 Tax=Vibrio parahaemolyticus TaxID=670 RepID=UPI0008138156|nr:hypothetical protein [Vibrio parahaemolyticus]MCR9649849.1 hypothetical protein [Vibrio parahaemolyticus]OCP81125.1 hypothetical protein AKH11_15640 [Vibrio parahaemolyticus]HBC3825444.1 hypothetical protein [Vibrio parahaemolyticus]HBC3892428.1 hypothetical protein [Vibrio parahaemolyticus]HCE2112068.1 hypothetical protein [Vibrio parahaemolyticus]
MRIKCFRHDKWEEVDIFSMKINEVFSYCGDTYLLIAKPYLSSDNKPTLPAELYEPGPIIINFDERRNYINMVMDYVHSDATEFEDGTMIIAELCNGESNIYSPRLPIEALNNFCRKNIDTYAAFYKENEKALESGQSVQIEKFW